MQGPRGSQADARTGMDGYPFPCRGSIFEREGERERERDREIERELERESEL